MIAFQLTLEETQDFLRRVYLQRNLDCHNIQEAIYYYCMLFNRVPDAFDCEADAEYDFSKSKLAGGNYQDVLVFRMTDFFHHTLADYYLDRFSNMLRKLKQLVDEGILSQDEFDTKKKEILEL